MSWYISLSYFSANDLGAEDPGTDSKEAVWGMVESQVLDVR